MQTHPLPNPARLRQIPAQFSWVDQRLVREAHFQRSSCEAMALYLFLVTVADARGVSYYGQASLMKQLNLSATRFLQARDELVQQRLIAYQHPLYQVLTLEPVPPAPQPLPPAAPPMTESDKADNLRRFEALRQWALGEQQ